MCAWCKAVLETGESEQAPISHGICRSCARELTFVRMSLREILQTLPSPVLAIDSNGRVLAANTAAASLVKKDLGEIEGLLGGDALSCVYAGLPGGCGRTTHCDGCTVRRAVELTHSTGAAGCIFPAHARLVTPEGPRDMQLRISTERVNEIVLLRIDHSSLA